MEDDQKYKNTELNFVKEKIIFERIKFLVERGDDVTANNNAPIRLAFEHGYAKILKYLHEHGADLAAITDEMIHCADANGYVDVIEYLADNGVAAAFNTRIMRCLSKGHVEVVKYLHRYN